MRDYKTWENYFYPFLGIGLMFILFSFLFWSVSWWAFRLWIASSLILGTIAELMEDDSVRKIDLGKGWELDISAEGLWDEGEEELRKIKRKSNSK